jgi:hypothetical protein
VLADADNNVWIRMNALSSIDREVWDVVNETGTLVDRVRMPVRAQLIGFGRGGIALLLLSDGMNARLVKVRAR